MTSPLWDLFGTLRVRADFLIQQVGIKPASIGFQCPRVPLALPDPFFQLS